MSIILITVVGFLLTSAAVPSVIRLANSKNCLDRPGRRRMHKVPTPTWGGVALFLGAVPALVLAGMDRTMAPWLLSFSCIVLIGFLDDRRPLPPSIKIGGMVAAAAIVVLGDNITIIHLGNYGALGDIDLSRFSVPFTIFCIVGVTNAINLLDGLNGLAGGVSLLGFLCMGGAALLAGNLSMAVLCFGLAGAIVAFLRFNFPRAKIFMGDTGSLFLGFTLAVTAVILTQDVRYPVDPMFPVLVLFLPIYDALRVMLVRLASMRHPFHADKGHFHHLLVRRGFTSRTAVVFLWCAAGIFGLTAFVLAGRSSLYYLVAVLVATMLLSVVTELLIWRQRRYVRQVGSELRRRLLSSRGTYLL